MEAEELKMPQQTFNVSENVQIKIRSCHNRVTVWGWEDKHTVVSDVPATQEGDTILVENASKVTLRIPRSARLLVEDCEADVRLDDLTGQVELSHIGGDIALRALKGETLARALDGDLIARGLASLKGEGEWDGDVALRDVERLQAEVITGDLSLGDIGEVTIQKVEGDLSARGIRGDLRVDNVEGDVTLRDVKDVHMAHAGDDFVAAGVRGVLEAVDIEGDAVIAVEAGSPISLRADGDIVLNFAEGANADIELDALHGDITELAGIQASERDGDHLRGTLGSGGAPVRVESTHGDIVVRAGETTEERHQHGKHHNKHWKKHFRFARMGQEIAEETRQAVEESLAEFGVHGRRHNERSSFGHRFEFHGHSRPEHGEPQPAPERDQPRGPTPGSPERKEILDAIARGEMSVDDAIRKLRGQ
jgi:hypothetical protein